MLSANRNLSPTEAIRILEETATDLGPRGADDQYGNGLVNALEAVRRAQR